MCMKSIEDHCDDLSRLLEEIDRDRWPEVVDWLNLAAGLLQVDLDTVRYDRGFGWCSGADEAALIRQDLMTAS